MPAPTPEHKQSSTNRTPLTPTHNTLFCGGGVRAHSFNHSNPYCAEIICGGQRYQLGYFPSEPLATTAFNQVATFVAGHGFTCGEHAVDYTPMTPALAQKAAAILGSVSHEFP